MANRERKRAERRKRKARGGTRLAEGGSKSESSIQRGYAKSEQRNQAARETLHPLYEGERPTVVTVGAGLSGMVALIFWASAVVAVFNDSTINGREPHPLQLALTAGVVTAMAWGMWKARYWAVLGFQVVLAILILLGTAGLVTATTVPQVVATVLLVVVCLAFFLFMVKAMARIQMPTRISGD